MKRQFVRPAVSFLLLALLLFSLPAAPARAALPKPDPDDGAIKLPEGFRALVVADNLGPLRFLTVAANGDVFVKTKKEGILALRDKDGDGRAELKESFGSGGGTGIALRDGWLYHSSTSAIYRYKLEPGQMVPTGPQETIVSSLPDGGTHNAKSFTFDDAGQLIVEIGSPNNAYGGEKDRALGAKGSDATEFLKAHGGLWRFDPNKQNQTPADGVRITTGHRHVIALAWNPVSKALFGVQMGRDNLSTVAPQFYTDEDNAETPAEELHIFREGANLGWPYTYYDPRKKARMLAPEFGGDNKTPAEPGKYQDPLVPFPGHWAPLQMTFYRAEQFPPKYRGGAFVAFHGSWNRAPLPQQGYNIAFVPFDEKGMPKGTYEVFADGFKGMAVLEKPRDARFRPGGVAVGPDGSLYVAETEKGRVWRIYYVGVPAKPAAAKGGPVAIQKTAGTPVSDARGIELYKQTCAVCHMVDGSGVPDMQPALDTSKVVTGDPTTLIRVLLQGPDKALPATRERYSNKMPAFESWPDADIAAVVTYVRRSFGKKTPAVSAAQVAAVRKGGSAGKASAPKPAGGPKT